MPTFVLGATGNSEEEFIPLCRLIGEVKGNATGGYWSDAKIGHVGNLKLQQLWSKVQAEIPDWGRTTVTLAITAAEHEYPLPSIAFDIDKITDIFFLEDGVKPFKLRRGRLNDLENFNTGNSYTSPYTTTWDVLGDILYLWRSGTNAWTGTIRIFYTPSAATWDIAQPSSALSIPDGWAEWLVAATCELNAISEGADTSMFRTMKAEAWEVILAAINPRTLEPRGIADVRGDVNAFLSDLLPPVA